MNGNPLAMWGFLVGAPCFHLLKAFASHTGACVQVRPEEDSLRSSGPLRSVRRARSSTRSIGRYKTKVTLQLFNFVHRRSRKREAQIYVGAAA